MRIFRNILEKSLFAHIEGILTEHDLKNCFESFPVTMYPCELDNSATSSGSDNNLPDLVDGRDEVNAITVNRVKYATLAIEYELGVNPSGHWDTVKDRLDDIDTRITDIYNLIEDLEAGVVTHIEVQDEGITVVPKANKMNFVGDAVTVTADPNSTTAKIVITGGLIMIQVQENFPVAVPGVPPHLFTLSYLPDDVTAVLMFVNGIKQDEGTDYTVSGKTVTYVASSLSASDEVEFWYLAVGSTVQQKQESFIASGGETGFTLSVQPTQSDAVQMYVNGIKQEYGSDYIVGGTAVTYNGPPSIIAGDIVEFWYITGISGGGGGGGDVEVRHNGATVVPVAQVVDFVGENWTITNIGGTIAQVEVDGYVPVQETLPVTANGQQIFTLTYPPGDETTVEFFIEGIKQEWGVDYTVNGTTVTYNDTDILIGDVVDTVYQAIGSGSGGGGPGGCCTLAATLMTGNITGGTDIEVTGGDVIRGQHDTDLTFATTGDGYVVITKDGYELARFDELASTRLLFPDRGVIESTANDIVLKAGTGARDGYVDVNLENDLVVRHWRYDGSGSIPFGTAGPVVQHQFPFGDVYYHGAGITSERGANTFQFYNSGGFELRTDNARDITMFSDRGVQIWGSTTNKNGGTILISSGENDGYSLGGALLLSSGGSDFGGSGVITISSAGAWGNSGEVQLSSGTSSNNDSGGVSFNTGEASAGSSGNVSIGSGAALTPGKIGIRGGTSTSGTGGLIELIGGTGAASGGAYMYLYGGTATDSGRVDIASGGGGSTSGTILIQTGGASTSGDITIRSGSATNTGDVNIETSGSSTTVGAINITAGTGGPSDGGNVNITSGSSTSGAAGTTNLDSGDGYTNGGPLNIYAGNGTTGNGGNANLSGGEGYTYGGNLNLRAGDGTTDVGGNLAMTAGLGTPTNGYFSFTLGTTIPLMRISDIPEPESIPLALMADSDAWVKGTIRDGRTFHIGTASISSGAATADVEIFTGDSLGSTGDITLQPGAGTGSGASGTSYIYGGSSASAASAGNVFVTGGNNTSTGSPGSAYIAGGIGTGSDGGNVRITGGTGSPNGGNVELTAGDGYGGHDGYIIFYRGIGNEVARWDNGGSERLLLSSEVVEFSGVATIGINSGYNALTFPESGQAMIRVANRSGGQGRPLYIRGSDATTGDYRGGNITIEAGNGNGSGDGGNVNIDAGADGGTGTDGAVNLKVNNTTTVSVVAGQLQSEGVFRLKEVADPGTPASGYWYLWADSSDGKVKLRADTGTTTDLATS